MTDQTDAPPARPSRHHIWQIAKRTLSKSWDDSIFSESAQAGFWSVLSLPPLLLGMLGSLAYIPLMGLLPRGAVPVLEIFGMLFELYFYYAPIVTALAGREAFACIESTRLKERAA